MDEPNRSLSADPALPGAAHSPLRRAAGFITSGLIAFSVDAAVLEIGVRLVGADPALIRLIGIPMAMVAGWLAHRRLTFAVAGTPTWPEFLRYAAAGWVAAALNWGLFVAILFLLPSVPRLAALVAASAVAMIFSYLAMRYHVFK